MQSTVVRFAAFFVGLGIGFAIPCLAWDVINRQQILAYGEFMYGRGYADGQTGTAMAPDKAAIRYEGVNHFDRDHFPGADSPED